MEHLVKIASECNLPTVVSAILEDDVKEFHSLLQNIPNAKETTITFKQNPDFPIEIISSKPPIICICALFGAVQCLTYLYYLGWNLNSIDTKKRTPLMFSIAGGRFDVFEYLLKLGANSTLNDSYGSNILHYAVKYNVFSIIQHIIENNIININRMTTRGASPLMWAAQFATPETINYLINKGADTTAKTSGGWTLMHYSAASNNVANLKFLVEKGFDINEELNNHGTPLTIAISENANDAFIFLVENGANTKFEVRNVTTPFAYAAINNNTELMNYLIEKSNFEITINDIEQTLNTLCERVNLKTIQNGNKTIKPNLDTLSNIMTILVSKFKKDDIDKLKAEEYIYSMVARKQNVEVLQLFDDYMEINWDWQNKEDSDRSIFLCACIADNIGVLDFLKSKCKEILRPSSLNETPISVAQQENREKLKEKLRNYGVPI